MFLYWIKNSTYTHKHSYVLLLIGELNREKGIRSLSPLYINILGLTRSMAVEIKWPWKCTYIYLPNNKLKITYYFLYFVSIRINSSPVFWLSGKFSIKQYHINYEFYWIGRILLQYCRNGQLVNQRSNLRYVRFLLSLGT